jgi:hypothetical protein
MNSMAKLLSSVPVLHLSRFLFQKSKVREGEREKRRRKGKWRDPLTLFVPLFRIGILLRVDTKKRNKAIRRPLELAHALVAIRKERNPAAAPEARFLGQLAPRAVFY